MIRPPRLSGWSAVRNQERGCVSTDSARPHPASPAYAGGSLGSAPVRNQKREAILGALRNPALVTNRRSPDKRGGGE